MIRWPPLETLLHAFRDVALPGRGLEGLEGLPLSVLTVLGVLRIEAGMETSHRFFTVHLSSFIGIPKLQETLTQKQKKLQERGPRGMATGSVKPFGAMTERQNSSPVCRGILIHWRCR